MTTPDLPDLPGQPKVDAQVQAADAQASQSDDAPSSAATKAELVDHAVSQGMPREDADKLTKDDLKARYGGK